MKLKGLYKGLIFLCLFYHCSPIGVLAQELVDGEIVNEVHTKPTQKKVNAATDYIDLYQRFISRHKNNNCGMYPSCSNYGLMVFSEQPFYKAIGLTADRLTRCSHDVNYYGVTYAYNRRSALDYPCYKKLPGGIEYRGSTSLYIPQLYNDATVENISYFVNHLMNNRSFEIALLEIERSLYAGHQNNAMLYQQKMLCYEALGKEEQGIFEYESVFPEQVRNNSKVAFKAALLYDQLGNKEDAERLLYRICISMPDSTTLYKAYTLRGIIASEQMDFTLAQNMFKHATEYTTNQLLCRKNQDILTEMQNQKYKSASAARWLSLVPGLGYLYTGHKGSALTSLAINSLLGYATYTSFKSKNYGVGILCSFVSLSFYIGNINGAGRSAIRYNNQSITNRVSKLKELNPILFY